MKGVAPRMARINANGHESEGLGSVRLALSDSRTGVPSATGRIRRGERVVVASRDDDL